MRKLIAAAVAVVSVGAVALPSTPLVHADDPAEVEVDDGVTTDDPPITEPEPEPVDEPEQEALDDAEPPAESEPEVEVETETAAESETAAVEEDEAPPTEQIIEKAPSAPEAQRQVLPQVVAQLEVEVPWTEPPYPELPEAPVCTVQMIQKHVSTFNDGVWSPWAPFGGVQTSVDIPLRGHLDGPHEQNGDRHYAYLVVATLPLDEECRPTYDPDVEEEVTDCQTGDTEVTVTTTTTTYKAVWNETTETWDKMVDEVTEETTTRPLNEQEQEECSPTYDPEIIVDEGECETGDDFVSFSTQTTTFKAVWNSDTGMWDKEVDEIFAISGVRQLTEEEQAECEPPAKVEESEWEDGEYECEDTTVEQTRTVTTTTFIYTEEGEWVADEESATTVTETQVRDLEDDEITECPVEAEIEFTTLGPVCLENIPYIRWIVTGEGFDPSLPLTITISLEGELIQTIENAPYEGQVIWPGASADPADWPGWVLNDAGVWVEDPSDEALRGTLTVTVSVNPEASGTVDYPDASEACADPPPNTPPTTPGTTPQPFRGTPTLPATGTEMSQLLMLASFALVLGISTVLVTRRRRLAD